MTEALIKEIQDLVSQLAGEIGELSGVTRQSIIDLENAVNDIASHTIAMEAIIVALVKRNEIDSEEVVAWIQDKTREFSEDPDDGSVAEELAKSLLGVETPQDDA